jgi:phenylalanyl-tRNA synthetase beta chain
LARVRTILAGCGLSEAQGQTLVSDQTLKAIPAGTPADRVIRLENPLSSDMNVLRPSLLPGLIESLRHNAHRQNADVRLFEIGRVFSGGGGETREERRLALVLTGARAGAFWSGAERGAKIDFYDLKGAVEELFEALGVRGVQWTRAQQPSPELLEQVVVQIGKNQVGAAGQLNPVLAKKFDLRDPVFVAEFSLDFLLTRRSGGKSFKALAAFPAVRRDIAMFVPEAVTHDQVLAVVRQTKPANLESAEIFDVFRGKNVPEGRKSVAYAFTYRGSDRTLTEAEVNGAHEKLVSRLKSELQAETR